MKRLSVLLLMFVFLTAFTVMTPTLFPSVKVGEEVLEKTSTPHPYEGAEGVVWQKTFTWGNAGYIALHFSNFHLGNGDYVEISSPDGRFSYKYMQKGKWVREKGETNFKQISDFWATHIPGETAIVKLYATGKKGGYGFEIDKWAHGYEPSFLDAILEGMDEDADAQLEAICNADNKLEAKCYEGTEMYNKGRAVCRLLIGGTNACTGWLLGDEGHIITNNHCISTQSSAGNTDYEFMAEGPDCAASCRSWGACPGTVVSSAGTLIKTDGDLDYTLILLPVNVSGTYGFMQLRDTLPTLGERIYIPQHPSAYGKQLAVVVDGGANATVTSLDEPPCIGGPGDIGYFADTEGGSSGSPVLAFNDHKVVALHHCANCPNRGVPIPPIITSLGTDLPNNSVGPIIPQPPIAGFTADPTTVLFGNPVQFTDQSAHQPTTWSWSFPGGTPTSSTVQHPLVTYNTLGTYSVTLTVSNALGSDTVTKTNYITVTDIPPYCASQGNNQSDEYIGRVQIGNLDNTSGPSPYSDFTNLSATLTGGSTVNVVLTPVWTGTLYTEYFTIWIDYNRDGDFTDTGETVFTGSTGSGTVSGSFVVKDGIDVTTRMRVTMKYGSAATPCETFTYGEVEDYTAIITTGTTNPPTAAFSANPTTVTEGGSVNFTDQSTNTPTAWNWTFAGGTPATSAAQNPVVTYNTPGTYTVELTATNSAGSDTETKVDYITVNPVTGTCIGTITNAGFETGDFTGWTATGATISTTANTGSYGASLANTGHTVEQVITGLCPNTTYRVAAYGKARANAEVFLGVGNYGGATQTALFTDGKNFQQQAVTFTTGATNTSVTIYATKTSKKGSGIVDDFSIVKL